MEKDKSGNFIFLANRDNEVEERYLFTKNNYASHSLRHNISGEESLRYIETAIQNPDCITDGKAEKQRNYYLIVNSQHTKSCIVVKVYRIICFRKGRAFYKIATVIDFWSPNYQVINKLEKIIWKKKDSLI